MTVLQVESLTAKLRIVLSIVLRKVWAERVSKWVKVGIRK